MNTYLILRRIAEVARLWRDDVMADQLKGAKFLAAHLIAEMERCNFDTAMAMVENECKETPK